MSQEIHDVKLIVNVEKLGNIAQVLPQQQVQVSQNNMGATATSSLVGFAKLVSMLSDGYANKSGKVKGLNQSLQGTAKVANVKLGRLQGEVNRLKRNNNKLNTYGNTVNKYADNRSKYADKLEKDMDTMERNFQRDMGKLNSENQTLKGQNQKVKGESLERRKEIRSLKGNGIENRIVERLHNEESLSKQQIVELSRKPLASLTKQEMDILEKNKNILNEQLKHN